MVHVWPIPEQEIKFLFYIRNCGAQLQVLHWKPADTKAITKIRDNLGPAVRIAYKHNTEKPGHVPPNTVCRPLNLLSAH